MLALSPKRAWLYPIPQAWFLEALRAVSIVHRNSFCSGDSSWPHAQPPQEGTDSLSQVKPFPIAVFGPELFLPHPSGRQPPLILPQDHTWPVSGGTEGLGWGRTGPGKCEPCVSEGVSSPPSSFSCLGKVPKEGQSGRSDCWERRGCSYLSSTRFPKL